MHKVCHWICRNRNSIEIHTKKGGKKKTKSTKNAKKIKCTPRDFSGGSVVNNLLRMICVCVLVVTQLCLILCKPMDCIQPGSSVHGDSPGKNTGVGYHSLLQGIFPTQGPNPGLPHCRWSLYCLSHQRMKGTWVWSLVWDDPTCHSVTKSCATTRDPRSRACEPHYWDHTPQLLKPEFSRTHGL